MSAITDTHDPLRPSGPPPQPCCYGVDTSSFHLPPPSYGGDGPQGRRGKAPVEVPASFRSEILEDHLCGLPPPPPSGAPPPCAPQKALRRGRHDFRVVSTP